jgi:hypothetical protein
MGRQARLKLQRRAQPAWTSFEQRETVSLPGHIIPIARTGFQAIYVNSRYQVLVRQIAAPEPFGAGIHLSIKRLDRESLHDWRDIQRIKNELIGKEAEAVELYPAESRLVDGANQYHLWSFRNFRFPFGFQERMVRDAGQELYGAKQRKFESPVVLTSDESF